MFYFRSGDNKSAATSADSGDGDNYEFQQEIKLDGTKKTILFY